MFSMKTAYFSLLQNSAFSSSKNVQVMISKKNSILIPSPACDVHVRLVDGSY